MTTLTNDYLESLVDRADVRAEMERIAREQGTTVTDLCRLIIDTYEELRAQQ